MSSDLTGVGLAMLSSLPHLLVLLRKPIPFSDLSILIVIIRPILFKYPFTITHIAAIYLLSHI